MYYHASTVGDISILEPRISNHNIPLIYFSDKRENVLVYLSNAVEKVCKENDFPYNGTWKKWGPYGFDKDGRMRYEEYYPNAFMETYKGVSGYIYSCKNIKEKEFSLNIPNAYVSEVENVVDGCEYIEDAYEEILKAEREGLITIMRYEEFISRGEDWLRKVIREEYDGAIEHPEYRYFLEKKFKKYL